MRPAGSRGPRLTLPLALGLALAAAVLPLGSAVPIGAGDAPARAGAARPAEAPAAARPDERGPAAGPDALFLRPADRSRLARRTERPSVDRLRFYTPNLIAPGATGSPPRDTDADQIATIFTDEAATAQLLASVDVYGFFGASVGRADGPFEAMLGRAIPMLREHGVKLALEVGGPLGYAPPTVYGGDTGGHNGIKSARLDLGPSRIGKIERLGGSVDYLMLDGALRRTIRNGEHSDPHHAYLTVGSGDARLRFTATQAGRAGNGIHVELVVGAPGSTLSVDVVDSAVTVTLAADDGGHPASTAGEVVAATAASRDAASLVTAALAAGSDSDTVVRPASRARLAYGDDGLNMTIDQSVAELVAYIATIHEARPNIRFVLIENTILWPYRGVAGYQSTSYPEEQRPDFHDAWQELVRQLDAAGLRSLLVGMHNDHPIEYPERQIRSINREADDWYGRTLRLQAHVESDGVAFAQLYNSVWGGDPGQDNKHVAPFASAKFFHQQVLEHVSRLESYRLAHHPELRQSKHFAFDAFLYYPRIVSPATIEYSTDHTYLEALALFESFADAATTDTLRAPDAAFAVGTRAARRRMPIWVSWAAEPGSGNVEHVQLQRRVDGGSWIDVTLPAGTHDGTTLWLPFARRHQLRVRTVSGTQAGPWLTGQPFVATLYDQTRSDVVRSGRWRQLTRRPAIGGSFARARVRGARAHLSFVGHQVAWIGQRSRRHGTASVYLDGVAVGEVRLRARRIRWREVLYASATGDAAPRSIVVRNNTAGRSMDVDAFVVLNVLEPDAVGFRAAGVGR